MISFMRLIIANTVPKILKCGKLNSAYFSVRDFSTLGYTGNVLLPLRFSICTFK